MLVDGMSHPTLHKSGIMVVLRIAPSLTSEMVWSNPHLQAATVVEWVLAHRRRRHDEPVSSCRTWAPSRPGATGQSGRLA